MSFAGFKAELDKHRIDLTDNSAVKFTSAKLELDGICNDSKNKFVRVESNLQGLYQTTDAEISALKQRRQTVENVGKSGGGGGGGGGAMSS